VDVIDKFNAARQSAVHVRELANSLYELASHHHDARRLRAQAANLISIAQRLESELGWIYSTIKEDNNDD
jgi:hypothetical protein